MTMRAWPTASCTATSAAPLQRASSHAWSATTDALGIKIARVLTDNGSGYCSKHFRNACRRLGIKHSRPRPRRPQTNGKAERFIQTLLREWAYARTYQSYHERAKAWLPWLHHYNWHRPHASLNYKPPIRRLGLSVNNLSALHT